jgi:hypothetical protein
LGVTHEVAAVALAYVRCACSWNWQNHLLKGKSDEDLAAETMAAFEEHRTGMDECGIDIDEE